MIGEFVAHEYNVIGIIGVAMVLSSYFLLQIGRLPSSNFWYSFFNFLGSIFILVSLCYTWNLASGVIEIAWLLISSYGLFRYFYARARRPDTLSEARSKT